jgi:hypothetical protein
MRLLEKSASHFSPILLKSSDGISSTYSHGRAAETKKPDIVERPHPGPLLQERENCSLLFLNSGDWISRQHIRQDVNVQSLFLLLGEKVRMRANLLTDWNSIRASCLLELTPRAPDDCVQRVYICANMQISRTDPLPFLCACRSWILMSFWA